MAAVGSAVILLKGSVFNNVIHFSVQLVVSNIETPLPLPCFKIAMFLDRLSMTYCIFHRYFLVWPLTMLTHCPVHVLSFSTSLGKTVQILPQQQHLLILLGYGYQDQ